MSTEGDFQPYPSAAPRVGMITQWMDDKGYGWVESGVMLDQRLSKAVIGFLSR